MLLELDDMVYYSSFPDSDNQMEQEEGSDSDGHSLCTFLALSGKKVTSHTGRAGDVSSEICKKEKTVSQFKEKKK